jgi:IS30 family transposase
VMGKQYTEEEKRLIQELAQQGCTDEAIAQQLGRSTNAIRNYRHRTNINSKETMSIQQLKQQTHELEQKRIELENRIRPLRKTRQIEKEEFQQRLENELIRLKDTKPELFQITAQDQLSKLTVELGSSILRWLIE